MHKLEIHQPGSEISKIQSEINRITRSSSPPVQKNPAHYSSMEHHFLHISLQSVKDKQKSSLSASLSFSSFSNNQPSHFRFHNQSSKPWLTLSNSAPTHSQLTTTSQNSIKVHHSLTKNTFIHSEKLYLEIRRVRRGLTPISVVGWWFTTPPSLTDNRDRGGPDPH